MTVIEMIKILEEERLDEVGTMQRCIIMGTCISALKQKYQDSERRKNNLGYSVNKDYRDGFVDGMNNRWCDRDVEVPAYNIDSLLLAVDGTDGNVTYSNGIILSDDSSYTDGHFYIKGIREDQSPLKVKYWMECPGLTEDK